MCPPSKSSPPHELDLCGDNEQLIFWLGNYTEGSNLPSNVLADLSPYQQPPAHLPEGIWYIVTSGEKKESNHGVWKAIGEPCKIYSNDSITGWITTLEYSEGGQRTDWVMQEYSITRNELCNEDKTKDSRFLCRVFLSSGPHNYKTEGEMLEIDLRALICSNINSPSGHDSLSESTVKCECETRELPELHNDNRNLSPSDSYEQDCISAGDFLELNDLVDCASMSSSSQNSSCNSNLSDEYFDSLALLREIEKDENKHNQQENKSSSKCSVTTTVRSDNVVLQCAASGSHPSNAGRIELFDGPQTGSDIQSWIDITAPAKHNSEGTETTTSGAKKHPHPSEPGPSGEKKAGSGRLKKLKLYFCFFF